MLYFRNYSNEVSVLDINANPSSTANPDSHQKSSVALKASYDAGWQKRGTGHSYNSLTGMSNAGEFSCPVSITKIMVIKSMQLHIPNLASTLYEILAEVYHNNRYGQLDKNCN